MTATKLNPGTQNYDTACMIEVFKTGICQKETAAHIRQELLQLLPAAKISFDLEDCDHILRIVHPHVDADAVIACLHRNGLYCEILNDE